MSFIVFFAKTKEHNASNRNGDNLTSLRRVLFPINKWFEMRKTLCEKKLFPYNIWTNSFKAIHGTMVEPLVNNLTIISDLKDINKIYFKKNENIIGSLKFSPYYLTLKEISQ